MYSCRACHHEFEERQSFSDPALTTCPQCAGTLRKLFNSVGVVFKGSGFYRTDSRNERGKKAASTLPSGETKSSSTPKTDTASGTTSGATKTEKPTAKAPVAAAA
jgi:putative FmdB family regulatory protein